MYDVSEFEPELQTIKNETIREFTRFCLENAPPYFWEVPSSSGGKYHSRVSNGVGGLVRHTRGTAYTAKELAPAYSLTPDETDAAISAAILHDICKYGLAGGKYTVKDHDYIGSNYVFKLAKRFVDEGNPEIPLLRDICSSIAYHFGRWSAEVPSRPLKDFPEDYSRIEQVVHVADMVASRKDISFGFLDQETLIA